MSSHSHSSSSHHNNNKGGGIDTALGLGPHLVGKTMSIRGRSLDIVRQLGEGGFSFAYLVRCRSNGDHFYIGDNTTSATATNNTAMMRGGGASTPPLPLGVNKMVLKITSIGNAAQQHMAEKEARLLQMLSHPSIIQVYDACMSSQSSSSSSNNNSTADKSSSSNNNNSSSSSSTADNNNTSLHHSTANNSKQSYSYSTTSASSLSIPQYHLILMEYCEGGTAYDSIKRMKYSGGKNDSSHRFDLSSLVIAFGQICNAVSYLHAQHPPIIHRDLKPVNFLLKNGAYKVCDFGSAVIGHTDLRTPELRRIAEEVVNKTTTQMFRAPEMVDLYMTKRLTEATDVWALGCCLYSLAYLCDCFEEGSNLAILSCKYKIPANNPYGDGLVDLLDRMLTLNYKDRATMSEVIMCLSALYSNRPLPKRTRIDNNNEKTKNTAAITAAAATTRVQIKNNDDSNDNDDSSSSRATKGTYKTDGQGIRSPTTAIKKSPNRNIVTAKKLDPNSAAAKRKKAAALMTTNTTSATIHTGFFPATTPLPLPQQQQQPSHQSSASHTATTTSTFDTTFDDNFGFDSSNFHDTTSTSQEEGIEVTTSPPSPTKNGGVDDDNVSFSTSFEQKCQILDSATITATAATTTTTSPLSSAFDTSNSFTWPTTENEI